jgi:hypothetical protein
MSRLLKTGLLAAVVALIAAAVGTAIAATDNSSPKPKARTAASLNRTIDKRIRRLAPKLHVAFAKNANNANRSSSAVSADSVHKTGIVTASAGQTVDLLTIGPFKFTLACRAGSGTTVTGEVDVTSSEPNVSIETASTAQAANFPAGTAYPLTDISTSANSSKPDFDGDGGYFTALAPSGTVISGDAYVGTRIVGHDCAGGLFALN